MPNLNPTLTEGADDSIVRPEGPTFKIFSGAMKAFMREDAGGVTRKMLSCTASSTSKDLHGDNMTDECVMGMAPQAKAKGMTIFLNHSYKWPEDVAGKTVDARVVQRQVGDEKFFDLDLEIELNESNSRAVESWTAIKEQGIKAGISIGAMINDYAFKDEDAGFWGGLEIKEVDLLEASIVGIPANQRSWVVNGLKALGAPQVIINKALGRETPMPKLAEKSADAIETALVESKQFSVDTKFFLEGEDVTDKVKVYMHEEEVEDDGTVEGAATPDTTASSPETETTEGETDADEQAGDTAEANLQSAADAVTSLKSSGLDEGLLEIVLGFLEGATEEVASLRKTVADQNIELAQARQDVQTAAEIVETIAKTPLGRKAQFSAPVQSFRTRLAGVYDEDFLKVLEGDND